MTGFTQEWAFGRPALDRTRSGLRSTLGATRARQGLLRSALGATRARQVPQECAWGDWRPAETRAAGSRPHFACGVIGSCHAFDISLRAFPRLAFMFVIYLGVWRGRLELERLWYDFLGGVPLGPGETCNDFSQIIATFAGACSFDRKSQPLRRTHSRAHSTSDKPQN